MYWFDEAKIKQLSKDLTISYIRDQVLNELDFLHVMFLPDAYSVYQKMTVSEQKSIKNQYIDLCILQKFEWLRIWKQEMHPVTMRVYETFGKKIDALALVIKSYFYEEDDEYTTPALTFDDPSFPKRFQAKQFFARWKQAYDHPFLLESIAVEAYHDLLDLKVFVQINEEKYLKNQEFRDLMKNTGEIQSRFDQKRDCIHYYVGIYLDALDSIEEIFKHISEDTKQKIAYIQRAYLETKAEHADEFESYWRLKM